MVIANKVNMPDGSFITEYRGLKSDLKPETANVGDMFIYEDQGDVIFKFTENGWIRLLENGGGGSSQDFVVGIEATFGDGDKIIITQVDKTFDQINDAIENNVNIRARLDIDEGTSEASLQYAGRTLKDGGGQVIFSSVTVAPIGNNAMISAMSVICASIPGGGERWMCVVYNATQ